MKQKAAKSDFYYHVEALISSNAGNSCSSQGPKASCTDSLDSTWYEQDEQTPQGEGFFFSSGEQLIIRDISMDSTKARSRGSDTSLASLHSKRVKYLHKCFDSFDEHWLGIIARRFAVRPCCLILLFSRQVLAGANFPPCSAK